jgi:hypothetical protein
VDPLREILTVATRPVVMLTEELARIDGIESAFIYGSFAARMPADRAAREFEHLRRARTRTATRQAGGCRGDREGRAGRPDVVRRRLAPRISR